MTHAVSSIRVCDNYWRTTTQVKSFGIRNLLTAASGWRLLAAKRVVCDGQLVRSGDQVRAQHGARRLWATELRVQ